MRFLAAGLISYLKIQAKRNTNLERVAVFWRTEAAAAGLVASAPGGGNVEDWRTKHFYVCKLVVFVSFFQRFHWIKLTNFVPCFSKKCVRLPLSAALAKHAWS